MPIGAPASVAGSVGWASRVAGSAASLSLASVVMGRPRGAGPASPVVFFFVAARGTARGDAAVLVVSVHGGAGVGRNLLNEIFPQRLRRKER